MFQNKTANKIIAVFGAILIWMYVVGSVDPVSTQKFEDIPITVLNEDSLIDQGYSIVDNDNMNVDLTLKGSRADLAKVESNDIKVTADVYDRHKGKNYVTLEIDVPEGITVSDKSKSKVLIEVEETVSEEKTVDVKVQGTITEGYVVGNISTYPKTVKISGAKSTVAKVKQVVATVDAEEISDEDESKHTPTLVPVDGDGTTVNYIRLSTEKANVTIDLYQVKEFPLDVKTTGEINELLTVEEKTIPEKIWIKGPKAILNDIDTIETESIDLSAITDDVEINVVPIIPEGAYVDNSSKDLAVKIKFKDEISQEFEYTAGDINIKNLDADNEATVLTSVVVTVTGDEKIISTLKEDDVVLNVDLDGLEVGKQDVEVENSKAIKYVTYKYSPKKVSVEIVKKDSDS